MYTVLPRSIQGFPSAQSCKNDAHLFVWSGPTPAVDTAIMSQSPAFFSSRATPASKPLKLLLAKLGQHRCKVLLGKWLWQAFGRPRGAGPLPPHSSTAVHPTDPSRQLLQRFASAVNRIIILWHSSS